MTNITIVSYLNANLTGDSSHKVTCQAVSNVLN